MKPRTPATLFTGTIIIAVSCAAWLANQACRPASDKAPRQPVHSAGIVPKA